MSFFSSEKGDEPLLDETDGAAEPKKTCWACDSSLKAYKIFLSIISVFLAPLAMFMATKECGFHVILSVVLYILGFVGAILHALIVIWGTRIVDRNWVPKQ